jgi:hypothetical protein
MHVNAAFLRTLIVATGAGFVAASLGTACLDFAGEDWGACATTTGTASSGVTSPGTSAYESSVDCGVAQTPDSGVLGSGSGSASP